jgi:hypothetical protein
MTFSFISSNVNLATIENVALISVNLGQGCNFKSDPLRTSALTTNIIGVLTPYLVASKSYLYADTLINHPMTINRPSNNNFIVKIENNFGFAWADNTPATPSSYVLTLSLKQV